jgi:hypothetical protein
MLQNWKSTVERDSRISMREMRSSGRRMIARDPTRPISSAAYGRRLKVSTLGGGCKEDEAVAMKTKDSAMIFPLEGHPLERIRARSIDP